MSTGFGRISEVVSRLYVPGAAVGDTTYRNSMSAFLPGAITAIGTVKSTMSTDMARIESTRWLDHVILTGKAGRRGAAVSYRTSSDGDWSQMFRLATAESGFMRFN
jgi:hypothetical protein